MTKKLINNFDNEMWLCENTQDTVTIDGYVFIRVYKNNALQTALMRKDAFSELITNENVYNSRNQLNG